MEQLKVSRIANVIKFISLVFLVSSKNIYLLLFIQCNSKSIKFMYARKYIRVSRDVLPSMWQKSKFTMCCLFLELYNINNSNNIKFMYVPSTAYVCHPKDQGS